MNIPAEQITDLHEAIAKVCPIAGVSLDKGRIDFAPEATDEQRVAARQVFDTWDATPAAATERQRIKRRLPEQIETIRDLLASDTVLTNAQISRLLKFVLNRVLPR